MPTATVFGRRLGALIFATLFLGATPGVSSDIEIPEKPRPDESPRGAVLTGQDAIFFAQSECRGPREHAADSLDSQPGRYRSPREASPEIHGRPEDSRGLQAPPRVLPAIHRDCPKRICVNFVHYNFVRLHLERPYLIAVPKGVRAEDFWKQEPIVVMDGGADFFTVQFDVESGTFIYLGFNGYA